jgi:ribonuclease BN (tRNA processing enzyme)
VDRRVFLELLAAGTLPCSRGRRANASTGRLAVDGQTDARPTAAHDAGWQNAAAPDGRRTRAILLGTAGGPMPKRGRSAPASVVLVDGVAYVVDCGNGVARQMVLAGVELNRIRHVFITHHHSDHNADFGTLLLLAWTAGLTTPVDTWGPPPLAQMTELFLQMSAPDIDIRIADEARPPLKPLIRAHDLREAGLVVRDERVTVRCAVVHHPMVPVALAYRIDGPDRSIVFSGDTTRTDSLIALARGADVLVHEVLYPDVYTGQAAGAARSVAKHILESHTPVEEVGRIAQEAGVKTLVLSHFVPDNNADAEQAWLPLARRHFTGTVIVGRDLLEI